MIENQLEQEPLTWLTEVGYTSVNDPDISTDGIAFERRNYTQVVLVEYLRQTIILINLLIHLVVCEVAFQEEIA
jgi:hypothetical protein